MDIVTLAHGSGGINAAEFVQKVFMPYFKDLMPYANEDCGIFSSIKDMKYVTSTDSYTINPIFLQVEISVSFVYVVAVMMWL